MAESTWSGWLSTGDMTLDRLLESGLPRGMLTLVIGPAGAGRAHLAHQLCRTIPESVYALCLRPPAEALRALHPAPWPEYVDLSEAIAGGGVDDALTALDHALDERRPALLIIDDFDGLFARAPGETERRLAVHRLSRLLWARQVAAVALKSSAEGRELNRHLGIAHDAAATILRLSPADTGPLFEARLIKREGGLTAGSFRPYRLTAQGLHFELSAPTVREPDVVSTLGARILSFFSTARRTTADELAGLLGLDETVVRATLDSLVAQGYLKFETDDGRLVYIAQTG